MTAKSRILLLSPGFAAHETDYNCIPPLQMFVQELQERGMEVVILTLGYPFDARPYRWHGAVVQSGYGFNKQRFRWLNWLRMLRFALKEHKARPFDVIHSFWLGPCWLIGQGLAWYWDVFHLNTLMGQDVLKSNAYLRFLAPRHGQNLVALSPVQNDCFEQQTGFRASHIIPWGIPDTPGGTTRDIDILGCGALIPLKNVRLWLETAARVARTIPGLKLVFIGDGPERAALERYAEELDISASITFSGHIPRAEVLAYMQRSKVFLHSSQFESFGFVLVEAMSCGCQVVSTPVGIGPEMAVCGESADALAGLCIQALRQPTARRAAWMSMSDTVRQYLSLYNKE